MKYKIGDKLNVIIPGISPTVANIDNMKEKEGKTVYCISFHEERYFTLCREVTQEVLDEYVDTYSKNKDNLEEFMMLSPDETDDGLKHPVSDDEKHTTDIVEEAKDITRENMVDFTMEPKNINFNNKKDDG